MKIKAQKITQKNMSFYTFILNSKTLLPISYVSRRYEEPKKGMQRALTTSRLNEIAKYLNEDKEAFFPTNIVICFSNSVQFHLDKGNDSSGYLIIPEEKNIAQIIDGQHRLFGIEKSNQNLDLLCVGFLNMNYKKAAKIFLTINSKQKGINTSLVYELFKVTRQGEHITLLAVDIVDELCNDEESPWYKGVKLTDRSSGYISQSAFVNALKPILKDKNFPFSYKLDIKQQVIILKNYFSALKNIFKTEWGNPKSILTKTLGFNSLMLLFPKLYNECLYAQDSLGNQKFSEIFKKLKKEKFNFKSSNWGSLGGKKGATELEKIIWEKIQEN